MHTSKLSWNWHKCWHLPKISIQIPDTVKTYLAPCGPLKCEVKCIKYSAGKHSKRVPMEVEMAGTTTKDLVNGKADISGITFATTSHNNKGAKLHLVISIYGVAENIKNYKTTMIASFISPPIYVDTRSSTRDTQEKKDQKNLFGYINPFSSSDLSRIFINKSKRDGPLQLSDCFKYQE